MDSDRRCLALSVWSKDQHFTRCTLNIGVDFTYENQNSGFSFPLEPPEHWTRLAIELGSTRVIAVCIRHSLTSRFSITQYENLHACKMRLCGSDVSSRADHWCKSDSDFVNIGLLSAGHALFVRFTSSASVYMYVLIYYRYKKYTIKAFEETNVYCFI